MGLLVAERYRKVHLPLLLLEIEQLPKWLIHQNLLLLRLVFEEDLQVHHHTTYQRVHWLNIVRFLQCLVQLLQGVGFYFPDIPHCELGISDLGLLGSSWFRHLDHRHSKIGKRVLGNLTLLQYFDQLD